MRFFTGMHYSKKTEGGGGWGFGGWGKTQKKGVTRNSSRKKVAMVVRKGSWDRNYVAQGLAVNSAANTEANRPKKTKRSRGLVPQFGARRGSSALKGKKGAQDLGHRRAGRGGKEQRVAGTNEFA